MWFLAITSCFWIAATTVFAAPRGLTACPRHWTPEGEDANGCPQRCLNRLTGEKIHLIVRYTLKGALLKGCVQCEERWIENTDCVMILCPEKSPPCSPSENSVRENISTFSLTSRRISTEQPRKLSLELFKKLYPVEIMTHDLPGGGFMRLYMPSQVNYLPRYTKTQNSTNSTESPSIIETKTNQNESSLTPTKSAADFAFNRTSQAASYPRGFPMSAANPNQTVSSNSSASPVLTPNPIVPPIPPTPVKFPASSGNPIAPGSPANSYFMPNSSLPVTFPPSPSFPKFPNSTVDSISSAGYPPGNSSLDLSTNSTLICSGVVPCTPTASNNLEPSKNTQVISEDLGTDKKELNNTPIENTDASSIPPPAPAPKIKDRYLTSGKR